MGRLFEKKRDVEKKSPSRVLGKTTRFILTDKAAMISPRSLTRPKKAFRFRRLLVSQNRSYINCTIYVLHTHVPYIHNPFLFVPFFLYFIPLSQFTVSFLPSFSLLTYGIQGGLVVTNLAGGVRNSFKGLEFSLCSKLFPLK